VYSSLFGVNLKGDRGGGGGGGGGVRTLGR